MKKSLWRSIVIVVCGFVLVVTSVVAMGGEKEEFITYGANAKVSEKIVTLEDAIKPENVGKVLRISASIKQTCEKKGCWMVLTDGKREVRITFKDYAFFVPKDQDVVRGKKAIAYGIISEKVLSEGKAKHYAEDAGKSKKEIAKIKGDQKEFTMVAESVSIAK